MTETIYDDWRPQHPAEWLGLIIAAVLLVTVAVLNVYGIVLAISSVGGAS